MVKLAFLQKILIALMWCADIRCFAKFGIKVAWSLQFLKFQKARTKIEVFLALPLMSQLNYEFFKKKNQKFFRFLKFFFEFLKFFKK